MWPKVDTDKVISVDSLKSVVRYKIYRIVEFIFFFSTICCNCKSKVSNNFKTSGQSIIMSRENKIKENIKVRQYEETAIILST